jgi:hypothetical protein
MAETIIAAAAASNANTTDSARAAFKMMVRSGILKTPKIKKGQINGLVFLIAPR